MSLTALVDVNLRRHYRSVDLVAAPLDDGMVLHHHHGAHGPVLLPAHAALQHGNMETQTHNSHLLRFIQFRHKKVPTVTISLLTLPK